MSIVGFVRHFGVSNTHTFNSILDFDPPLRWACRGDAIKILPRKISEEEEEGNDK